MLYQDPIRIVGPLGRIYSFTRRYHGDDFFEGPRLAFHHDRAYARDHLLRLTRSVTGDPFNYRLLDVWQLVFQKPWTRPRNLNEQVSDLTDKIHRGELFVYLEPNLERNISGLLNDGPPEGEAEFLDIGVLNGPGLRMERPRVSGHRPANRPRSWGEDYASGLTDTVSAISSDIAAEQTELYDTTSGWGNVMYPVFKPVENFGSFIGNTVGLMSALSPKGMNPKVAEYWQGIGESFRALGSKVVDALGGDGRAAGEITPALASIVVARKIPDGIQLLDWTRKSPRTGGDAAHHVSRNHGSLNLNKPNQGVFYGNAVEVVNDAWRKAKSADVTPITVGNRDIYVVPRDNSGFAGGAGGQLQNFNHVTIITEKGTNRVVTAYPSGGTPPLPKNYEFPLLGGE